MFAPGLNNGLIKTTSYKVVTPFYIYAAVSFFIATLLLLISGQSFLGHYFHPKILAVTHTMALGWGTMIIFGAGHQLVPVLIEGKLYSEKLAVISFYIAAIGIPILLCGFYSFNMGLPALIGGTLVTLALLIFLINIVKSIAESKKENVHALYIFTATLWLFITALLGLTLVYNFTYKLLPENSVHFLPLHAHLGIVGWFLLLVIGVASRLIPLFLISKYTNNQLLWAIYLLINSALIIYILLFAFFTKATAYTFFPSTLILIASVCFIYYCYQAYKHRLRKQVDEQTKLSILSMFMLILPMVLLFIFVVMLITVSEEQTNLILTYGFLIFFGWITAIILGMTFKTLPFIIWNKVYHHRSSIGKTPSPKELFNSSVFNAMGLFYLTGLIVFSVGILFSISLLLSVGAILLIITSILYNWNVFKIINHKPLTL
ncbi:MAG: cytochrome c oxidase subunit I [Bacteroidia bacterium]|nr:cytochrome c oxidase subunit I [Bacteroidia bacterium]